VHLNDKSIASVSVVGEVRRVTITLTPLHDDLTFMAPLSEKRADKLVRFVAQNLDGTVLDIGCAWAELLLRVLAAAPGADGVGVDIDQAAINHGRTLADQRGLLDRVRLVVGDAKEQAPQHADAVICIGASQVWGPPVEANEPLDYASALAAVREMVPRGARVLYGEGVWSRPPNSEAVAPLSGRLDELVSVAELTDLAVTQGFMPVGVHEASLGEWDEFESGYSARYATWLAEHAPDHPDADEVRDRAARQRAAYFRGYRGVMGMAYLALLAV
jgi:SAM-dependent methyltransferase